MVVYEVNLHVDTDVAEAYVAWLHEHIREILQLHGFTGATLYIADAEEDGRRHFTVHYVLRDRASLDDYFERHAARFRQDGLDRFGGRFTADRRVLAVQQNFDT